MNADIKELKKIAKQWRAKLDLAEADAVDKEVKAAFKRVDCTIRKTGRMLGRLKNRTGGEK
jgi:hypothetical protein